MAGLALAQAGDPTPPWRPTPIWSQGIPAIPAGALREEVVRYNDFRGHNFVDWL